MLDVTVTQIQVKTFTAFFFNTLEKNKLTILYIIAKKNFRNDWIKEWVIVDFTIIKHVALNYLRLVFTLFLVKVSEKKSHKSAIRISFSQYLTLSM